MGVGPRGVFSRKRHWFSYISGCFQVTRVCVNERSHHEVCDGGDGAPDGAAHLHTWRKGKRSCIFVRYYVERTDYGLAGPRAVPAVKKIGPRGHARHDDMPVKL